MPEIQRQDFRDRGAAVLCQVPPGNSHIQHPVAHINSNVAGAQKNKFNAVIFIGNNKFPSVADAFITGLFQQFDGTVRKHAFVGYGNLQHFLNSATSLYSLRH